jgi:type IV pilus assembly protein PilW
MRGFSLVEILVAMLIALLGTVIIFQVFAVSEDIKRTSTSGGDAQQYGALALYTLERQLRLSGYGINNPALLGCTVRAYDELSTPQDLPNFTLSPVVITPGADDQTPDTVAIFYGNSDLLSTPSQIMQNMASATDIYKVSNRYGYLAGNLVVAAEPGKDCSIAEISETPTVAGQTDNVLHNSGPYTNAGGAPVTSRYNKPAGLGVSYTTNGTLYNLGDAPVRNVYSVQNGQLTQASTFWTASAAATAVADYIVHMKVQYGKDDGVDNGTVDHAAFAPDDGAIDNYTNTMPVTPTPADWARIITVRLAVVARAAQPERPTVEGGPCDATTVAPTWSGGTLDVSADPDWQCFRYRVFETTVPLRNLIWQQLT